MQQACVFQTLFRIAALVEQPQHRSFPFFRRYGKNFGKSFIFVPTWLNNVPRMRVRTAGERALEELLELVVANERLDGTPAHVVRCKLEYIKRNRKNWEVIYEYVTKQDAVTTLAMIEEANDKVRPMRHFCLRTRILHVSASF